MATSIKDLGHQAERHPPTLTTSSPWGHPLSAITTHPSWTALKHIAAKEGLVSLPYESTYPIEYRRIIQAAKLYLFGASSGLVNCPVAMSDGAAAVLHQYLASSVSTTTSTATGGSNEGVVSCALAGLTSRCHGEAWTSGQWMTERRGGSDVRGSTETVAVEDRENKNMGWYRLYGNKWFSSAADGEMALALANEEEEGGNNQLSLFYVPIIRSNGIGIGSSIEGITIRALKEKLGTRQLPTAELNLHGVPALRLSLPGRGIATISTMVNITRLHNCLAAASFMRRATALVEDYSRRRKTFGRVLMHHALAVKTIAWMHVRTAASLILCFELARLSSSSSSEQHRSLLRLLIPAAKAFTAKEAIAVTSEGLEMVGAQGYIEPTGIPQLLRDAQVLSIWEGSTNIMALDVLRVLTAPGSKGAVCDAFMQFIHQKCTTILVRSLSLPPSSVQITPMLQSLASNLLQTTKHFVHHDMRGITEPKSRGVAMRMCHLTAAAALLEQAGWSGVEREAFIAMEWYNSVVKFGTGTNNNNNKYDEVEVARCIAGADRLSSFPRSRY